MYLFFIYINEYICLCLYTAQHHHVNQPTYFNSPIFTCQPVYFLLASLSTCPHDYMSTYLPAPIATYLTTYLPP